MIHELKAVRHAKFGNGTIKDPFLSMKSATRNSNNENTHKHLSSNIYLYSLYNSVSC